MEARGGGSRSVDIFCPWAADVLQCLQAFGRQPCVGDWVLTTSWWVCLAKDVPSRQTIEDPPQVFRARRALTDNVGGMQRESGWGQYRQRCCLFCRPRVLPQRLDVGALPECRDVDECCDWSSEGDSR